MGRVAGDGICRDCRQAAVHIHKSGIRDGRCYDCMRAHRRKTEAERVARGYERATIEDDFLMLAAFPEPAAYLKMIKDISDTVHIDKRTIEHRKMGVAGPLGRARMAGTE